MPSVLNLNDPRAAMLRNGLLTAGSVIPISEGAKGQWLELRARDHQLTWGFRHISWFYKSGTQAPCPQKNSHEI